MQQMKILYKPYIYIGTPKFFTILVIICEQVHLTTLWCVSATAGWMANSVDPDQMLHYVASFWIWSGSTYIVCADRSVPILRVMVLSGFQECPSFPTFPYFFLCSFFSLLFFSENTLLSLLFGLKQMHAGLGGSVGCASNWRLGSRGFNPLPPPASNWRLGSRGSNPLPPPTPPQGRQHSFVEIDHEIFSKVILSLLLIQEGQLSVSGERMCTILGNCLEDQACPVNVWLGKPAVLDMTPLGRKTSTQTNFSLKMFGVTENCNFFPCSLRLLGVCKNQINLILAAMMQKFIKYFYFSCNSFFWESYFGISFSW